MYLCPLSVGGYVENYSLRIEIFIHVFGIVSDEFKLKERFEHIVQNPNMNPCLP